jgi:exoribonuclease II
MEGKIVEFIDKSKIVCAVVLEQKDKRLSVVTETKKNINLNKTRIIHISNQKLDIALSHIKLAKNLADIVKKRDEIAAKIDIEELWEILSTENEWIDIKTITELCFVSVFSSDHESAIIRAFFKNEFYFKFILKDAVISFLPNSEDKIKELKVKKTAENKKSRLIDESAEWLTNALSGKSEKEDYDKEIINILKSFYIFQKESKYYSTGKAILKAAKITDEGEIFNAFVNAGIWDKNENINIIQYNIPITFNNNIEKEVSHLLKNQNDLYNDRIDLTGLETITIDGEFTRDFDDALSIERKDGFYILGVHISDVGHFIKKKSKIDKEARERVSSIYMPDNKINMLPEKLSEEICSLIKNSIRPAISAMITLDDSFNIQKYEILPSIIKIARQITYNEANSLIDNDASIANLYKASTVFRKKRFNNQAVQITLPEINVFIDREGEIVIQKIDKEKPSKILVAELMIMANFIMGKFLQEKNMAAVFRAQPKPHKRLYKGCEGTLYQNWVQRKYLSRFILSHKPEPHSGLGIDLYTTVTSPIRKYFDLVTQRQLRASLGLETPYSTEEIRKIIDLCGITSGIIGKIQANRKRFFMLKYLEQMVGKKIKALVIGKHYGNYQIVLMDYMLACNISISSAMELKEEENIEVIISHVNARKNALSVYLA